MGQPGESDRLSGEFTSLDGDQGGYWEEAEVQPPSGCSSGGVGVTIQGGGLSYGSNCVLAAHPGAAAKGPWSVGSGLAWRSLPGARLLAARGSEASWVWTGVSSQLRFQEELPGAVNLSKCPPHVPDRTPTPSGLCEGGSHQFRSLEILVSSSC